MEKNEKNRLSFFDVVRIVLIIICVIVLAWVIVNFCNLQKLNSSNKQLCLYPEMEEIFPKYNDTDSGINGKDTVNYNFKVDTTSESRLTVNIIADDGTRVNYNLDYYWHIRTFIEVSGDGDTIFKYPSQGKLHNYQISAYVDPVYRMAMKKRLNEGTYQMITDWLLAFGEKTLYVYINKETSLSPNIRITAISAKISENGKMFECNEYEMGYIHDDNWVKNDPYYANRVMNIEIKNLLKTL